MENSKLLYKTIGISIATVSLIALIALTIHENTIANQQNNVMADTTSNGSGDTTVTDNTSAPEQTIATTTPVIQPAASTDTGSRIEQGDSDSDDGTGTDSDNHDESIGGNASTTQQTTATPVVTTPKSSTTTTPATTSHAYTDGNYSATGTYMSPGGLDSVSVSLTLKNDVITAITTTAASNDHTSRYYQSLFLSGYKSYVVGKDIASVNLTKVSGSSLTPRGFDAALQKIKTQAKA